MTFKVSQLSGYRKSSIKWSKRIGQILKEYKKQNIRKNNAVENFKVSNELNHAMLDFLHSHIK